MIHRTEAFRTAASKTPGALPAYVVRCACGWQDRMVFPTRASAERAGDEHTLAASAGEPLR